MKVPLTALIISKNNEDTIARTLESLKGLTSETVLVDEESQDKTVLTAIMHGAKVYQKRFNDIGKQRAYGLRYVSSPWVLVLDSDEVVSKALKKEMISVIKKDDKDFDAYEIPYLNHYLGKPLRYGGEDYKMIRLFRTKSLRIMPSIVHNKFIVRSGKTGKLKGNIYHYSYRGIIQVFSKFTGYSLRMAEILAKKGEQTSFRKILFYPLHMLYARFIKDKGYKDGLFRIPLDLAFAYMEFVTYLVLAFKKKR